jgi:hypothetical protein
VFRPRVEPTRMILRQGLTAIGVARTGGHGLSQTDLEHQ